MNALQPIPILETIPADVREPGRIAELCGLEVRGIITPEELEELEMLCLGEEGE